jgi:iron complex transport system substrate-binding protein
MRICSFLPSATEILYELGVGEDIVGVTHECDYPSDAARKRVVVRSAFDVSRMNSEEINDTIVKYVRESRDIYVVDDATLRKVNPDLIVAQGMCEVCSPHTKELDRALNVLGNKPQVIVLDPRNFDDIMDSIEQVARAVGREQRGKELVQSLRKRVEYVRILAENTKHIPKVLCVEWLNPLFTAGHWVPEMVELANAVNGVSRKGEPSRVMEWDEVMAFNPEMIVLMLCGFDIRRTMQEVWRIEKDQWKQLAAVKNRQVYVADANSYFSRPGPRTVTGLEVLAKIIHPNLSKDLNVPEGSFRRL